MTKISRILVITILVLSWYSLALQAQMFSIDTLPPIVVKTLPQSGDTIVDVNLDEIQVTFSKNMLDGSWSWVQMSKESFPQFVGQPRFLRDKRTCVAKVILEPNKTYVIWLNSGRYMNFKDADLRPAIPYLLVFKTGKK